MTVAGYFGHPGGPASGVWMLVSCTASWPWFLCQFCRGASHPGSFTPIGDWLDGFRALPRLAVCQSFSLLHLRSWQAAPSGARTLTGGIAEYTLHCSRRQGCGRNAPPRALPRICGNSCLALPRRGEPRRSALRVRGGGPVDSALDKVRELTTTPAGSVAFVSIYMAMELCGLPSVPLAAARDSGVAYLTKVALAVVLASSVTAACVAYYVGRTRLRPRLDKRISMISPAPPSPQDLVDEGFAILLLLRMVPMPPAINYLYGAMAPKFPAYFFSTLRATCRARSARCSRPRARRSRCRGGATSWRGRRARLGRNDGRDGPAGLAPARPFSNRFWFNRTTHARVTRVFSSTQQASRRSSAVVGALRRLGHELAGRRQLRVRAPLREVRARTLTATSRARRRRRAPRGRGRRASLEKPRADELLVAPRSGPSPR